MMAPSTRQLRSSFAVTATSSAERIIRYLPAFVMPRSTSSRKIESCGLGCGRSPLAACTRATMLERFVANAVAGPLGT